MLIYSYNDKKVSPRYNQKFLKGILSNIIETNLDEDNYDTTINHAFSMTEGRCLYCGDKLYYVDENGNSHLANNANLDHIIPASAFGLLVKGNGALTCVSCNSEKSNLNAIDYFNSRYKARTITLYDTPADFKAKIDEFEAIYSNDWPMIFKLNKDIISGRVTEISLENLLMFASFNPKNKSQFIIPIDYNSNGRLKKFENRLSESSNLMIDRDTQAKNRCNTEVKKDCALEVKKDCDTDIIDDSWIQYPPEIKLKNNEYNLSENLCELIEIAIFNTGRENGVKINKDRQACYKILTDIESEYPNISSEITTIEIAPLINEDLYSEHPRQLDSFKKIMTIASLIVKNPGLVLNESYLKSIKLSILNKKKD